MNARTWKKLGACLCAGALVAALCAGCASKASDDAAQPLVNGVTDRQTCYLKSRTKPKLLDRMLIIEYGIERHVDLLLRGIRIYTALEKAVYKFRDFYPNLGLALKMTWQVMLGRFGLVGPLLAHERQADAGKFPGDSRQGDVVMFTAGFH